MSQESPAFSPWTILARLVRPQGRHGEILADILTDFPERFADRRQLALLASESSTDAARPDTRVVALENHWLHKGRIVLKFAGIDSITDAEALRGLLVAVPATERAPLTDGSFYIGDLIGCQVFDLNTAAAPVGVIEDVDPEAALLQLKTPTGTETLLPFAKAYLVTMDLAGKRIEMRLPAGLLDINAPISDEERRAQNDTDSDD